MHGFKLYQKKPLFSVPGILGIHTWGPYFNKSKDIQKKNEICSSYWYLNSRKIQIALINTYPSKYEGIYEGMFFHTLVICTIQGNSWGSLTFCPPIIALTIKGLFTIRKIRNLVKTMIFFLSDSNVKWWLKCVRPNALHPCIQPYCYSFKLWLSNGVTFQRH